jgi:CHASE2 domain-containing sensor protein
LLPRIWSKFNQKITTWSVAALPGIVALGLVILLLLSGSLQFLEWVTLDSLLGARLLEPMDQRVVIVGIDEEDIQRMNHYPISDREIAKLLRTLQK